MFALEVSFSFHLNKVIFLQLHYHFYLLLQQIFFRSSNFNRLSIVRPKSLTLVVSFPYRVWLLEYWWCISEFHIARKVTMFHLVVKNKAKMCAFLSASIDRMFHGMLSGPVALTKSKDKISFRISMTLLYSKWKLKP